MAPSPDTTVAVVLGAQDFSRAGLESDPAFRVSASEFTKYLLRTSKLDLAGLALPKDNVLDLFDATHGPDGIDAALDEFLVNRVAALEEIGKQITDLLVYYTGHGAFTQPNDDYVLVLKATRKANLGASAYHLESLATTLKGRVRHARRFLILDCCFAASAYAAFQAPVLDVARRQSDKAFPGRGTSLLCASAHDRPAKSRLIAGSTPSGMTLFSECLVSTLAQGVATISHEKLTLADVGLAIESLMAERFNNEGPRPQVKSPDERDGDVSRVPLFPNAAVTAEKLRMAKEIERLVGTLPHQLTTEERTFCEDILLRGACTTAERSLLESLEELVAGQLAPKQFKRLVQVAHSATSAEVKAQTGNPALVKPVVVSSTGTAGPTAIERTLHQVPQQMAQPSLPQPSLPQPSLPQPSLPQPSLPQPSLPQPSLPQPSLPQPSLPQPSLPQPSLPQPSLPQLSGTVSSSFFEYDHLLERLRMAVTLSWKDVVAVIIILSSVVMMIGGIAVASEARSHTKDDIEVIVEVIVIAFVVFGLALSWRLRAHINIQRIIRAIRYTPSHIIILKYSSTSHDIEIKTKDHRLVFKAKKDGVVLLGALSRRCPNAQVIQI